MDSSDAVIPSSSQVNLSDEKLSLNPACQIALEKMIWNSLQKCNMDIILGRSNPDGALNRTIDPKRM